MRNLLTIALALIISGCTPNANTRSFVATPVPDEIRTVIYSVETSAGSNTWKLTNDDLRIRHTVKSGNGTIVSDWIKVIKPNDYNWVVYNLEQAKFTKVKSLSRRVPPRQLEKLTVITQSDVYTYTQNNAARFPNGFQKVINVIPGLANSR